MFLEAIQKTKVTRFLWITVYVLVTNVSKFH